jgi:hypothetical protein
MADDRACIVCFHEFTVGRDSEHEPIVIPCGHTYCLDCWSKLEKCPLCEKKIKKRQHTPNYALISNLSATRQFQHETKENEILVGTTLKASYNAKRKQEKSLLKTQQVLLQSMEESRLVAFALEAQTKRLRKGIEETKALIDVLEAHTIKQK